MKTKMMFFALVLLTVNVNAQTLKITEPGTYEGDGTVWEEIRIEASPVELLNQNVDGVGGRTQYGINFAVPGLDDVKIFNCRVTGARYGIGGDTSASNVKLHFNEIDRNQIGVMVRGRNWELLENDITRPWDWGPPMGDADYVRVAGSGITFKRNRLWGANVVQLERIRRGGVATGMHVDGFQFSALFGPGRNITWEDNIVMDFHQGILGQNNGDNPDLLSDWVLSGNVFARGRGQGIGLEQVKNVTFKNNAVVDTVTHGLISRFDSSVIGFNGNVFVGMKAGAWFSNGGMIEGGRTNGYFNVNRNRLLSSVEADVRPFMVGDNSISVIEGSAVWSSRLGPAWLYTSQGVPMPSDELPLPPVITPTPTPKPTPTPTPGPALPATGVLAAMEAMSLQNADTLKRIREAEAASQLQQDVLDKAIDELRKAL